MVRRRGLFSGPSFWIRGRLDTSLCSGLGLVSWPRKYHQSCSGLSKIKNLWIHDSSPPPRHVASGKALGRGYLNWAKLYAIVFVLLALDRRCVIIFSPNRSKERVAEVAGGTAARALVFIRSWLSSDQRDTSVLTACL